MTGLWLRILIGVLSSLQAGITALLAFTDLSLPVEAKAGLVAASAAIAVLLNQIPSWRAAPRAGRAINAAKAD